MPVDVAPAVVVVAVVVMAAILLLVLCTCAVEFLPFRNARFEAKEDGLITFGVALARMCIALAKDCTRRMLAFLCTIAKARETMMKKRITVKTKHDKDTSGITKQKKYIARLMTALKEVEMEEMVEAATKID